MIIENRLLNEMINEFKKIRIIINELEEKDTIKEYNTYKNQNEKLSKDINHLIESTQNNCNHEVWYHLSTSTDDYEGRTYYNCKCLDCDLITVNRSKYFKNVIYTKERFEVVQEKYEELKNVTDNQELLLKLLQENFKE